MATREKRCREASNRGLSRFSIWISKFHQFGLSVLNTIPAMKLGNPNQKSGMVR